VAATKSIEIRTEIPGPRSRELLARGETSIAKPLQVYLPIFAAEALNATVTDVDGNTCIDFAGGVGVVNVGHCHPKVVEAIQEQAATFVHTDFTVVPYASYVELAERLGELAPFTGPTRAAFFNSGAEAVENAVKIARLATGRPAVIAFEAAFHGRTMLAMTMTSRVHPYKDGMGPFAPEVYRAPFPSAYRGPSAEDALARLERMFASHVAASQVAACIRERMLGWQGRWPRIGDVRGLGAMLAIELVLDPASREPAPELAAAVIDAALERGLILLKAGISGNCIRVLCPLTIEDAVLDEALAVWEDALESVLGD